MLCFRQRRCELLVGFCSLSMFGYETWNVMMEGCLMWNKCFKKKSGLMKTMFHSMHFRNGFDHLFHVYLSFQEMRWVGGLPLISLVPWNFPNPLISFVSHPEEGGTVLGKHNAVLQMQIHVQMFSNESCDAQLEHQDFEISPPSAVEKKCVSASACQLWLAFIRKASK